MDHRNRVYYLINLNQNFRKDGWWCKGWDNFGSIYSHNLRLLRSGVPSLKITPNRQVTQRYYQMKVGCKKQEEHLLIEILNSLDDVNFMKIICEVDNG